MGHKLLSSYALHQLKEFSTSLRGSLGRALGESCAHRLRAHVTHAGLINQGIASWHQWQRLEEE